MKICWDKIEGMRLNSKGNFYKPKQIFVEMDSCKLCGEPYLTSKSKPSEFCNSGCAQALDLNGYSNNRLTVLEFAYTKDKQSYWKCVCDCGNTVTVIGDYLKRGNTKSCGCLKIEAAKQNIKLTHRKGKDHPSYNPNLTDEDRVDRRIIPGYRSWRVLVYELDNYICQMCGDNKGGNLNAHHIEAFRNNPHLRTEVSNGITLCETCHKDFHHQYGYGDNTRAQLIEFLRCKNE